MVYRYSGMTVYDILTRYTGFLYVAGENLLVVIWLDEYLFSFALHTQPFTKWCSRISVLRLWHKAIHVHVTWRRWRFSFVYIWQSIVRSLDGERKHLRAQAAGKLRKHGYDLEKISGSV